MVELVPTYQWPRFDFRFIATGFVLVSLIFFGSFHTSRCLPLRLALCEGRVYCLWPLPRVLLVCTTLVRVLVVATPLYCLWPLPRLVLVCTTVLSLFYHRSGIIFRGAGSKTTCGYSVPLQ